MRYEIKIMDRVLGEAKDRVGIIKIIQKHVKSTIGRTAPLLPYALVYNDVINALYIEKATFLRETHAGEWNLSWYADTEYKDTFYFVRDISDIEC